MGKSIEERRSRRIQALVARGTWQLDEEGLSVEELREALRRYILYTYGGSINTVSSYLDESLARIEHERERKSILVGA